METVSLRLFCHISIVQSSSLGLFLNKSKWRIKEEGGHFWENDSHRTPVFITRCASFPLHQNKSREQVEIFSYSIDKRALQEMLFPPATYIHILHLE